MKLVSKIHKQAARIAKDGTGALLLSYYYHDDGQFVTVTFYPAGWTQAQIAIDEGVATDQEKALADAHFSLNINSQATGEVLAEILERLERL